MAIGVVGTKAGMTRLFTESGESIPVTVVEVQPNRITQLRDVERDGYRAYQVTVGTRRASRVKKPQAGHFAKAGVEAGRGMWEFRLAEGEGEELAEVGAEIGVDVFEAGQKVDATGTSIGKGYAGVIKRYNFAMQDATHGNSLSHRASGSIGQNQTPGSCVQGQEDGRAHGCGSPYNAKSGSGSSRQRASRGAGQGCYSRAEGWQCHPQARG